MKINIVNSQYKSGVKKKTINRVWGIHPLIWQWNNGASDHTIEFPSTQIIFLCLVFVINFFLSNLGSSSYCVTDRMLLAGLRFHGICQGDLPRGVKRDAFESFWETWDRVWVHKYKNFVAVKRESWKRPRDEQFPRRNIPEFHYFRESIIQSVRTTLQACVYMSQYMWVGRWSFILFFYNPPLLSFFHFPPLFIFLTSKYNKSLTTTRVIIPRMRFYYMSLEWRTFWMQQTSGVFYEPVLLAINSSCGIIFWINCHSQASQCLVKSRQHFYLYADCKRKKYIDVSINKH